MEVSITRFRRDLFELVNKALHGGEVWVTYKGQRFKVAPENKPAGRLHNITPLEVINPEASDLNDRSLLEEMARAWEKDWSTL